MLAGAQPVELWQRDENGHAIAGCDVPTRSAS
jgi:hypothetical protein